MSNSAASPFSFHCMICFEEFHPDDRYPVVLPCGHTYVCNVCSEKLERCMECRTTLFAWTVPPPAPTKKNPQQQRNSNPRWGSNRSNNGANAIPHLPSVKPQSATKTRLPLPKNVVLLSLMEATELATERAKPASPSSLLSSAHSPSIQDEGDDAAEEEDKIREGTSLALSGCGTYVVTSRDGLLIFPTRPSNSQIEEDIDTLVRFFHLDNQVGTNSQPGQLSHGDRVQIVSLDGGWAKLARGYGFIQANMTQIVKVGGSVDRACKLEAMLHTLSNRRKELRRDQSKVDSKFVLLMKELQTSLLNDEDLTVIVGETFSESREERDMSSSEHTEEASVEHTNTAKKAILDEPSIPRKLELTSPIPLSRQETPQMLLQSSSMVCGFPSMTTEVAPSSSREDPHETSPSQQRQQPKTQSSRSSSIYASAPPSAMSAGAQAWRERHGRSPVKGIDFRTGMSGHMGVLSTHAHPHDYLSHADRKYLAMSNHTGISAYKSVRKAPSFPPDG